MSEREQVKADIEQLTRELLAVIIILEKIAERIEKVSERIEQLKANTHGV